MVYLAEHCLISQAVRQLHVGESLSSGFIQVLYSTYTRRVRWRGGFCTGLGVVVPLYLWFLIHTIQGNLCGVRTMYYRVFMFVSDTLDWIL